MTPLILGSTSPRRKEILSYFNLPFTQESPSYDEESVPFSGDPLLHAQTLAEGKAAALASLHPDSIILSADTVVYKEGRLYSKPANAQEAFEVLSSLNAAWHSVFTVVTARKGKNFFSAHEETKVLFHSLTPDEIRHYIASVHTLDKAGGYAIQGHGGIIVKRIEGCYYNAMGLSINALRKVLLHFQMDIWHYL